MFLKTGDLSVLKRVFLEGIVVLGVRKQRANLVTAFAFVWLT